MNKKEQLLIDKFYEGRMTWSHIFIITLYGLLENEMERRIRDFSRVVSGGDKTDGIQDDE